MDDGRLIIAACTDRCDVTYMYFFNKYSILRKKSASTLKLGSY